MRAVLVGAVASSEYALRALAESDLDLRLALTLPPHLSSRHADYVDLGKVAGSYGIPVAHVARLDSSTGMNRLLQEDPDYLFVIGWSELLSRGVLSIPSLGVVGYHPSLLPELRGRGVIPWTILLERPFTGSTLFWLDEGIDSGDVAAQARIEVSPRETARSLYDKHCEALEGLVIRLAAQLARGDVPRTPQDERKASWCAQRTPADGRLNWSKSAVYLERLVRASTRPYPGAVTYRHDQEKVVVWNAQAVDEPYFGIPGQVLASLPDRGVLVQCGEGHLLIEEYEIIQSAYGTPARPLRRQDRLA